MYSITVVNKKRGGQGIYIGRPSPLGNPYPVEKYGRDNCISMYEQYLRAECAPQGNPAIRNALNHIYREALKGPVNLVCWCAPLRCHGDVIKKIICEAVANQGS